MITKCEACGGERRGGGSFDSWKGPTLSWLCATCEWGARFFDRLSHPYAEADWEGVVSVLRQVDSGEVGLRHVECPHKVYAGNVEYLLDNGWRVVAFNDCGGFDYIEAIKKPGGPWVHVDLGEPWDNGAQGMVASYRGGWLEPVKGLGDVVRAVVEELRPPPDPWGMDSYSGGPCVLCARGNAPPDEAHKRREELGNG